MTFSRTQKQVRLSLSGMFEKEPLIVCNVKERAKIGKAEECKRLTADHLYNFLHFRYFPSKDGTKDVSISDHSNVIATVLVFVIHSDDGLFPTIRSRKSHLC